ncbi:kelch-like protein 18 [Oppia nitens]|uniref:kelch-like protein 18 n=1 Tax=Oppia nitens TaxID=1686743 RepID=UPI0023DB6E02|nr:kelch-like protein 18 [Oppia nitens]
MDVLHMAYISSTNNITKPKISLYRSDKLINDNILPIDLTNNPQIYVCGGYDGQQFYSQCYKLDILLNNWSKDSLLDHMIHSRYHLKLIQFDNKLYSIGGRQDISTNWVETYDTRNNLWAVVSPLNIKRYGLGAAVINNTIYVCGGLNTNELSIKSCEYFTRETNEWMFTNPMLTARDFHELVAHEGCLYAIGGNSNNNNQSVNTVEKYEHSSQTWEQVANMTSARSSFGAISFMGKIYVCGGRTSNTGQTVSNICEVYDSHTNKWTQISSMKESRFDLQLVTYNDKLYAVGGDKTNTIEIYDYMSDRWSHSITLPTKVGAFGVSIYKN